MLDCAFFAIPFCQLRQSTGGVICQLILSHKGDLGMDCICGLPDTGMIPFLGSVYKVILIIIYDYLQFLLKVQFYEYAIVLIEQ